MSARLFLRPARQDHKVLASLLAPGGGAQLREGGPLLGGVVVDATVAESRPQLAEAATAVGIPVLVDPASFFLQGPIERSDTFAKLPYGALAGSPPSDLDLDQLIDTIIEFEVSNGATTLVVPYFHVTDLEGGWAALNRELPLRTAQRCERLGVNLPAIAVLSGNRKTLSSESGLAHVGTYLDRAVEAGAGAVALCTSPAGKPGDTYGGISQVVRIVTKASPRLPVIAWRQGIYGPALVALGAAGYECGMGSGETTDIASMQSRRRPKSGPAKKPFSQPAMVYLPEFERSVKPAVAKVLLHDPRVQGELLCDRPGCCSSVDQTLSSPRPHAVRARAAELDELNSQPNRWKVQHQLRKLDTAIGTAKRANEVLDDAGLTYRVPVDNLQALATIFRGGPLFGSRKALLTWEDACR